MYRSADIFTKDKSISLLSEQEVLGKQFKVYGTAESPLFAAIDVACWIDHTNVTEMLKGIDEEEKLTSIILRAGQKRQMNMLTEDGLYEVLMQSRKPIAKQFKKKVKEILKDIRKNGIYATDNVIDKILNNPDFGIELLTKLKEERETRIKVERENTILISENERMKPKEEFFDAVTDSKDAIEIGKVAKVLDFPGVGRNKLFEILRDKGVLMRNNIPYQKYIDNGCFRTIEQKYTVPDGETRISIKTLVYQKGVDYIRKVLDS